MNLLKQTKYIRTHEHILKSVCLKIGNNKYYEDEQEKGGGGCVNWNKHENLYMTWIVSRILYYCLAFESTHGDH